MAMANVTAIVMLIPKSHGLISGVPTLRGNNEKIGAGMTIQMHSKKLLRQRRRTSAAKKPIGMTISSAEDF